MIAIVASNSRERNAFAALCVSRAWPHVECESLRTLKKYLRAARPKVVLTRHKVGDGYSDDVIAALRDDGLLPDTKVIVLAAAGTSQLQEARQVALGADCVQRDPVRSDVLVEYLARYLVPDAPRRPIVPAHRATSLLFAGACVFPLDRRLARGARRTHLTPREVELVELLAESPGAVVTYAALYTEILERRFRGDTSNLRVLLGKLEASYRRIGGTVRSHVEVISKTGYRYTPDV